VALGLGLILLLEALFFVFSQRGAFPVGGTPSPAFGSPVTIGEVLFSQYLLPFEVTSILLLTALIGAIVLSKRGT
jgi:NADH-quinone oxidoreductase subunit J